MIFNSCELVLIGPISQTISHVPDVPSKEYWRSITRDYHTLHSCLHILLPTQ